MTFEELKPCPFCLGKADIVRGGQMSGCVRWYTIFCKDCKCQSKQYSKKKDAVAAWNTRHIPKGYVLVPIEPTDAMLGAVNGNDLMSWDSEAIYKAMIQAAQTSSDVTKEEE